MRVYDIIFKKREGGKLSKEEIEFMVNKYTTNEIPDYQMSAFLMAIFMKSLDDEETTYLTQAMTNSGKIIDLSSIPGIKVDKHSTGGVGDGTSLSLVPLVASCGVCVPMISGRALGHTGGTLDKLESIPGFNVNLTEENFLKQLKEINCAIISQTEEIVPADKKIYALRDLTATVDSIPLISASIMSKKLAEGCDALVLDVKTGNGAFMRDYPSAKRLAKTMVNIGKKSNKKTIALITDMNQPLGEALGNSLEVKQAIEILKGEGPKDITELVLSLSGYMLMLAKKTKNLKDAKKMLLEKINSGEAMKKLKELIKYQNGDPKVIDMPNLLESSKFKVEIKSEKSGYISYINTKDIGVALIILGGGRERKEDKIDHSVGIEIYKKISDTVEKNEVIAKFHYNDEKKFIKAKDLFLQSIMIKKTKPKKIPPLIYEVIK